ncbi:uncharacterized protein LOC134359549 isoform X2 [Mobula hypostoma]|uniref:uncharacterized protein LOC134359549 isoform X2 n=1 Tax=Mobula hypostoma TaxID=723540 RepID=UPI002FC320A0
MLSNGIIFVHVISSFVMESKVTAAGVMENEVPQASSLSFQSDVTGLIHVATTSHQGFGQKLPLASWPSPPRTGSNVNPLPHTQMSTPPAQGQASTSPLFIHWVPTVLSVEKDIDRQPLLVPHIRLKTDDSSENSESVNQDDIGSPTNASQQQAATFSNGNQVNVAVIRRSPEGATPTGFPEVMNKSSNPTDISIPNLSTVRSHRAGLSVTSLMYPARLGTTQERSMMPIYTFPSIQKRPATVRPIITTQNTEAPRKIKPQIQTASDHSVLFTVSELPPGIVSPSLKRVTHQTATSANDNFNNGLSTLKTTPLGITQFNEDMVLNNTAAPSNTLGRSEPTSKSHLTSSPDKGTLDYLLTTLLSFTPAYQTQQMKVDELSGIATLPMETMSTHDAAATPKPITDMGNGKGWDSVSNPQPLTPPTSWTMSTEFTDSIVGIENSSGIESSAAPTESSYSSKQNCSSCEDRSSFYPDVKGTKGTSLYPHFLVVPPLFVTLHTDWNTALAEWGLAWDLHVYGDVAGDEPKCRTQMLRQSR